MGQVRMRAEGDRSRSRRAFACCCCFQSPEDGGADYLREDINFLIESITDGSRAESAVVNTRIKARPRTPAR